MLKQEWVKKFIGIMSMMVLVFTMAACSEMKEQIDKAVIPVTDEAKVEEKKSEETKVEVEVETEKEVDESSDSAASSTDEDYAQALKIAAEKEGMSVKELEALLDGLAEFGAEKYGVTKEDYIATIELSGKTLLEEWQIACDFMGVSMKEMYEYEKANVGTMGEEQKNNLNALANAVGEAGDILAESEESGDLKNAEKLIESLLGMNEGATGEVREISFDTKEAFNYMVKDVIQDYKDDYSVVFEYLTSGTYEELAEYYIELLRDSDNYTTISSPGVSALMIQSKVNGMEVFVDIDGENAQGVVVNTYVDYSSKKED